MKYKYIEDISENGYIKAVYTDTPQELIRVAKEVDSILIDGDVFEFTSCEMCVPETDHNIDCIKIFVDYVC